MQQCVHNVRHVSVPQNDPGDPPQHRLTFHSQLKNELRLCLTEVDPFGNYSSPHYKGTAIFYKVPRGQLRCQGDGAERTDKKPPGDPACKLSLTLPKVQEPSAGLQTLTFTIKGQSCSLFFVLFHFRRREPSVGPSQHGWSCARRQVGGVLFGCVTFHCMPVITFTLKGLRNNWILSTGESHDLCMILNLILR